MALERIILNIIPAGDMPVFHCSQYENGRSVIIDLVSSDDDAYIVPEGVTVELHCRKCDDTIVTMEPDEVDNNTVTFVTSEQLTACPGDNLCELVLYANTDPVQTLGTLNFILHVEPDPLAGGLTSESEISNLTQQIEDITQEVIGNDYYNKTEVDTLLAAKADSDSVYTKGETDTLLADKANSSDVYTKGETDTLLSAKADIDDVYTKSETYTQAEVDALIDNIFPTFMASGAIASFITALTKPLVSVTADISATTVTACGVNLFDGSKVTTTTPSNWGVSFDSDTSTLTIEHKNTYSSGIPVFNISSFVGNMVISGTFGANIDLYVNGTWNRSMVSGMSFSCTSGNAYSLVFPNTSQSTLTYKVQLELGNTEHAFTPYTGNTVPVADATTLVTEAGINNVFADSGNVTVQYKYMSM